MYMPVLQRNKKKLLKKIAAMVLREFYQKIFPFVVCTLFLLVFWALVLVLVVYALSENDDKEAEETEEQTEIDPTLKIVMTCLLSVMLTVCVSGNSLTIIALSYVRYQHIPYPY